MPGNESTTATSFIPRDELKVGNADLTLIATSPLAYFDEASSDPWLNISTSLTDEQGLQWYAKSGLSILGCVEQYQFCTDPRTCSKLDALYQLRATPNYGLPSLTARQKAVAGLVWKSVWAAQLQYGLLFIDKQILVANELIMSSLNSYVRSSKIPSNQWVTEAWNFANISLAVLQRRPGDYASPAAVLQQNASRIIQPDTAEARALCKQIKTRSSKHTSFKVLSLALLPGIAALVTLLNGVLPNLLSKTSRHGGGGGGKNATTAWAGYGFCQLLRLMSEARGIGPWDRQEKTVPTLRDRDFKFPLFDNGI
ncbi:hypothetical protein B0H63DRAFT_489406 [Podospora didyma]|uniref:Uncharacterized protein n=1 Tax=Podospora didyma TaxID=330526 RepID=A0AAE0K031_9PEZI|nr:hypothetical protein B0H63DRAFT_489406 [Podospora didyma]